jgi:cytoskeletal protein RodZ
MNEAVLSLKHSTTESSTMGERLRYARESRGLSQREASKALCLSVQVIDALERDAHEKLPAPVFIQGYLKNYASFLSVPYCPEKIKTIIKPLKPPVNLSASSSVSWLPMIGYVLLKLLNYAVFIGLLFLLFLWWHDRHHAAEKELSLANLSILKIPFPRTQSEPVPPDLTPWLDVENIRIEKGENP